MKYNEELKTILKDNEFDSFWQCLDYLLLAGYKTIDAFAISLKGFSEGHIWKSTAFITIKMVERVVNRTQISPMGIDQVDGSVIEPSLVTYGQKLFEPRWTVGVFNDNTIHLDGIFEIYRKGLSENSVPRTDGVISELESNVTTYSFDIPELYRIYLMESAFKHYGYDMFEGQFEEIDKQNRMRELMKNHV